MASAEVNRSRDRSAQVNFRMSKEDRERLRQRAAARGMTVQTYLEHVALGYENPSVLTGGRPFKTQQELPLTG